MVKIILWQQESYGIIIETKSIILMTKLQMVNHFNIRQKKIGKAQGKPER